MINFKLLNFFIKKLKKSKQTIFLIIILLMNFKLFFCKIKSLFIRRIKNRSRKLLYNVKQET